MITVKIYKYDSEAEGYKGEDYSAFVLQGFSNTEKLNQELDVSEITLYGVDFGEEFTPGTKFIIDVYDADNIVQTIHRVCQSDAVDKPILSKENFYRHVISLIEPSVVAQERICDNISITYKLKDVALETRTTYDTSAEMENNWADGKITPIKNFGFRQIDSRNWECFFGKYFSLFSQTPSGPLFFVKPDNDAAAGSDKRYNNISDYAVGGEYKARFYFPEVKIWLGVPNTKNYYNAGSVSFDYEILAYNENGELVPDDCVNDYFVRDDSLDTAGYNSFPYSNDYMGNFDIPNADILKKNWCVEKAFGGFSRNDIRKSVAYKFKKYTTSDEPDKIGTYAVVNIKPNYTYKVTISLHNFAEDLPISHDMRMTKYTEEGVGGYSAFNIYYESDESEFSTVGYTGRLISSVKLDTRNTNIVTETLFYSVDALDYILQSAIPYSAYNLLVKSILNSGEYEKPSGISSVDINNAEYPCQFYIDPSYVETLQNTVVNETFFQQKNLWEIALVVGNYIHAIPEIKFGENDKYMFTFTQLGQTVESEDGGQKINILNTRAIDDYISSVSSYVDNIVQLGGEIQEKVFPKTLSENMLVYNDTAVIEVSKNIIELLEVKIVSAKEYDFGGYEYGLTDFSIDVEDSADMTRYIYEKNVYGVLPIGYNEVPNKGYAMYYELGGNVIQGGQYQLPRSSTDMYSDYAIKKIIFCAFNKKYGTGDDYPQITVTKPNGPWVDINVNDFYFIVRYRTKDSARVDHARPDLRKYLLASTEEKIPVHAQFNNQEDVLVDSEAFGTNIFGKLVRTGNTNYYVNEWHKNTDTLKNKGDLIRINGDLYYVAKVVNTYYSDHIVSEVEYSKDFNQLSQVVSIPSEPRFYEISEQSQIRREKVISDYMLATTDSTKLQYADGFVKEYYAVAALTFGNGGAFYKYAVTVFKGDNDISFDYQTFGDVGHYKCIASPINAFSSGNTLTYEWDMKDNFSAGDKVEDEPTWFSSETADQRYRPIRAVQYTDKYGKSTLMDFYILSDYAFGSSNIRLLPDTNLTKDNVYSQCYEGSAFTNVKSVLDVENTKGIVLLKDSRESVSINYNLHLLTDSDTFVTSPYFFAEKKRNLKIVLLANEINKLSNGRINDAEIITAKDSDDSYMDKFISYTISYDGADVGVNAKYFHIALSTILNDVNEGHFTDDSGYERIKAIAIIYDVGTSGQNYPLVIGRNIPSNFSKANAIKNWYFGTPNKDVIFGNKQ